jgi:hypothetical protein
MLKINPLDVILPSRSAAEFCAAGSGMAGEFGSGPINGSDRM